MDDSVDTVFPALQDALADELIAAFRFPGFGDDYFTPVDRGIELLLVVGHQASIHEVRSVYLAHCHDSSCTTSLALWVTTERAMRRYLHLNPLFSRHLANHGQQLCGAPLAHPGGAPLHPAEQAAFLAHRAFIASTALAPDRLSEQDQVSAGEQLRRLAMVLYKRELPREATAAELFALVQVRLQQMLAALSPALRPRNVVRDARSSNLEAMYEDREFLLTIIPPMAGRLLRKLDWPAVLQQSPPHLAALTVGTAGQLRLAVQSERPLDYLMGNFRHLWGAQPLSGLHVSRRAVFRQAARKPSELLQGLSADYVEAGDKEAVHRVIHDYQNRLLNMQLEHELLHRTQGVERAAPQESLPRRDEPNDTRIDAIARHFDWWAAYYTEKMAAAPVAEKMSPQ